MTQGWEPGTQYNYNDTVQYNGHRYKIIQPHRSQGDWAPDRTPALWGRIPDDQGQGHCAPPQQHYQQPQQQQHNQQQPYQQPQQPQQQQHNQQPAPSQEKPPKKGNDSGSESDGGSGKPWKAALGIAGGLLAGGALVGAGVALKKNHDRKEGMEAWLEDARYRTQNFRSGQGNGPVGWVLCEGRQIPQDAIPGGKENSGTLFIGRGFHKGSVTPGKASTYLKTGAVIGFAHDEIDLEKYEVLVGNPNAVRWISVSGKLNLQALGARPVDGGVDCNGSQLYVARAQIKGAVHPGKAGEHLKCAFIPYGGDEEETTSYEVLCYN